MHYHYLRDAAEQGSETQSTVEPWQWMRLSSHLKRCKVEGPSSRSNGMGWKWEVERKTGELNQLVGELVGGRWTGRSTDHLVGDGRWSTTDHVFGRWMVGDRPPTTKRGRKKSRIYVTYVRIVRNPGSCWERVSSKIKSGSGWST